MTAVDVALVLLLEFYTTIWVENPEKFPALRNKFSLENLTRNGHRKAYRDDLCVVIQQFILFTYNKKLDEDLGDNKNKKRKLDKRPSFNLYFFLNFRKNSRKKIQPFLALRVKKG